LKNKWGLVLKRINELAAASADNKIKGESVSRDILYEVRVIWVSVRVRDSEFHNG
jgi:hypothetical protein